MNYTINPDRIEIFNEHWYNDDDVYLPSVTLIQSYYTSPLEKLNLENWANTVKDPKQARDEAGEFGSRVHNAIENLLKTGEAYWDEYNDLRLWDRVCTWLKWYDKFTSKNEVVINPEWVEIRLKSRELGYAGTIDLIATVNGKNIVIDWKTGNFIGDKALEQVSAYVKLACNCGIECEGAMIIHLPTNNKTAQGYSQNVLTAEKVEYYYSRFRADLEHFKQKGIQPTFKSYPKIIKLR